jgi:ectoine hydroxylase-related dioxygenase (phytanoyl-CoA dioxygenase family)
VRDLLGAPIGLLQKIVLRIDLPLVTRELAVWHQDHFYVKGNRRIVTAWIPLQDTSYREGCLMVMPGSHELGYLPHTNEALGKRHYPTGIFERPVRYVEMRRGDALMFHALMLHSSSVNLSEHARLSIQARYTLLGEPTDPGMGGVIPV